MFDLGLQGFVDIIYFLLFLFGVPYRLKDGTPFLGMVQAKKKATCKLIECFFFFIDAIAEAMQGRATGS